MTENSAIRYSDDGRSLVRMPTSFKGEYRIEPKTKYISANACEDCRGLTHIYLDSDNLQCISDFAFLQCRSLKEISWSTNIRYIGRGAFSNCISLQYIDLPNSVCWVGPATFYACTDIQRFRASSNLEAISHRMFEYCWDLHDVELKNSIQSIGSYAFHGCNSLNSIVLPDNVFVIAESAFQSSALRTIVLSRNISDIKQNAFLDTHLRELYMRSYNPSQIAVNPLAFRGLYTKCTLYVPKGYITDYKNHAVFGKFKQIVEYELDS